MDNNQGVSASALWDVGPWQQCGSRMWPIYHPPWKLPEEPAWSKILSYKYLQKNVGEIQ